MASNYWDSGDETYSGEEGLSYEEWLEQERKRKELELLKQYAAGGEPWQSPVTAGAVVPEETAAEKLARLRQPLPGLAPASFLESQGLSDVVQPLEPTLGVLQRAGQRGTAKLLKGFVAEPIAMVERVAEDLGITEPTPPPPEGTPAPGPSYNEHFGYLDQIRKIADKEAAKLEEEANKSQAERKYTNEWTEFGEKTLEGLLAAPADILPIMAAGKAKVGMGAYMALKAYAQGKSLPESFAEGVVGHLLGKGLHAGGELAGEYGPKVLKQLPESVKELISPAVGAYLFGAPAFVEELAAGKTPLEAAQTAIPQGAVGAALSPGGGRRPFEEQLRPAGAPRPEEIPLSPETVEAARRAGVDPRTFFGNRPLPEGTPAPGPSLAEVQTKPMQYGEETRTEPRPPEPPKPEPPKPGTFEEIFTGEQKPVPSRRRVPQLPQAPTTEIPGKPLPPEAREMGVTPEQYHFDHSTHDYGRLPDHPDVEISGRGGTEYLTIRKTPDVRMTDPNNPNGEAVEGQAIATATIRPTKNGGYNMLFVHVDPRYEGQGIGTKLMEVASKRTKGPKRENVNTLSPEGENLAWGQVAKGRTELVDVPRLVEDSIKWQKMERAEGLTRETPSAKINVGGVNVPATGTVRQYGDLRGAGGTEATGRGREPVLVPPAEAGIPNRGTLPGGESRPVELRRQTPAEGQAKLAPNTPVEYLNTATNRWERATIDPTGRLIKLDLGGIRPLATAGDRVRPLAAPEAPQTTIPRPEAYSPRTTTEAAPAPPTARPGAEVAPPPVSPAGETTREQIRPPVIETPRVAPTPEQVERHRTAAERWVKALPELGGTVAATADGVTIHLKNGSKIYVQEEVPRIAPTAEGERAYRELHPEIPETTRLRAHGVTYKLGPNALIQIARNAEAGTENHEVTHVAYDMGLVTRAEDVVLGNKFAKGLTGTQRTEAIAEGVAASKVPTQLKRFIHRVRSLGETLQNMVAQTGLVPEATPNVERVVADIRTGKVLNRPGPPPDSPYGKGPSFELRPARKEVTVQGKKREERTFVVSIQPEVLAQRPDAKSTVEIRGLDHAREVNTNPERVKDWQKIYTDAKKMTTFGEVKKKGMGKLEGVPIISLTKGCQRGTVTVERVENGVLPNETRVEACYGGDCWVNRQFNRSFAGFENMEVRDLAMADPSKFDAWLKSGPNRAFLNSGPFIRMGQQGCDSHIIASGIAKEWLDAARRNGIKKKTIFISAGYAPVTDAQYRDLAPYRNNFELHISNSGWFHKNEILFRLAEFKAAKDAGLDAKIRLITNRDDVSGIKMVNEAFLADEMAKLGITQSDVLETPFHDDVTKIRSAPTRDWKYVCCETGQCKSCGPKCMTKIKSGQGSVQTTDEVSDQAFVNTTGIPVEGKFKLAPEEETPREGLPIRQEFVEKWLRHEEAQGERARAEEEKPREGLPIRPEFIDRMITQAEKGKFKLAPEEERKLPKEGEPFEFYGIRNTVKSDYMGSRFGQDVEPRGKYMQQSEEKFAAELDKRFERGPIRFENPLVIEFGGGYQEPSNWKKVLSERFGGKTGRELSRAIVDAGYDGIVTVEPARGENRPAHTSEIVDLREFKQGKYRLAPEEEKYRRPYPKRVGEREVPTDLEDLRATGKELPPPAAPGEPKYAIKPEEERAVDLLSRELYRKPFDQLTDAEAGDVETESLSRGISPYKPLSEREKGELFKLRPSQILAQGEKFALKPEEKEGKKLSDELIDLHGTTEEPIDHRGWILPDGKRVPILASDMHGIEDIPSLPKNMSPEERMNYLEDRGFIRTSPQEFFLELGKQPTPEQINKLRETLTANPTESTMIALRDRNRNPEFLRLDPENIERTIGWINRFYKGEKLPPDMQFDAEKYSLKPEEETRATRAMEDVEAEGGAEAREKYRQRFVMPFGEPSRTGAGTEKILEAMASPERPTGKPPKEYINFDRITSEEDVRKTIKGMMDAEPELMKQARGYRSQDRTAELAKFLPQSDIDQIVKEKGFVSAEVWFAAKQLAISGGREVMEAARKVRDARIRGRGVDDAEADFLKIRNKAIGSLGTAIRAGSEMGRGLAIGNRIAEGMTKEDAFFQHLLKRQASPALIEELANLDLSNPEVAMKALRAADKPKVGEMIQEYILSAMMSAPPTHIRNFVSNSVMQAGKFPEKIMAGVMDAVYSGVTGKERERYVGEAAKEAKALGRELLQTMTWTGEAAKAASEAWGEKADINWGKLEATHLPALPGKVGKFIRGPLRAAGASDAWFGTIAAQQEISARAYRRAKNDVKAGTATDVMTRMKEIMSDLSAHPDILAAAKKARDYWTFRDELGPRSKKILGLLNDMGILRLTIAPFFKTPVKITGRFIERSPIGLMRTLYKMTAKKYGTRGEAEDDLARGLMGTMMAGAIYGWAQAGGITGMGPEDPKQKTNKMATGWQPYSVKIGDHYLSYQGMEPLSSLLMAASNASQVVDSKDKDKWTKEAFRAMRDVAIDKTSLQGFQRISLAVGDPERWSKQFLQGLVGMPIPAIVKRTAQALDPVVRRRDTFWDVVKAGVPGLSQTLEPRRTITGEEVKREQPALMTLASPSQLTSQKPAPLERELDRIGYVPVYAPRKIVINKQDHELSQEQMKFYVEADRKAAAEALKVIGKSYYKNAPEEPVPGMKTKQEILGEIWRRHRALARMQVVRAVRRGNG